MWQTKYAAPIPKKLGVGVNFLCQKSSQKLGQCGRQNMLQPYLKIWDQDLILGRAVKAISSLGVGSPWPRERKLCINLQSRP